VQLENGLNKDFHMHQVMVRVHRRYLLIIIKNE